MVKLYQKIQTSFDSDLDQVIHSARLSKWQGYGLLIAIILLTAAFRVFMIEAPGIDRTAWKEIDYIMISKNYYENDVPFLHPTVSWPAEAPRITAMELPAVPYLASIGYRIWGVSSFSTRLPTLIFSLLLIFYIYKLTMREAGPIVALLAAFFSALLPLFSEFRSFLFSEPALLFFSVFSIYYFARWVDSKRRSDLFVFVLGFSLAIALKPTALYLSIPILWIYFRKNAFVFPNLVRLAGVFLLTLIIPLAWYLHAFRIAQEYIDVFGVFGGQFGGHDKFQPLAMLSDPEWRSTMFFRVFRLILSYPGFLVIALGILVAIRKKTGLLFLSYLLAILCFFVIVAEGQLDAPYRQLTIIPPASFFLALGAVATWILLKNVFIAFLGRYGEHKKVLSAASILICALFLLSTPLRHPRSLLYGEASRPFHSDNWILSSQIKKHKTPQSKIIMAGEYTIHKGGNDVSPVTYYYSGITGWTIQKGEWNAQLIDSLQQRGADLFGAINYSREPGLVQFLEPMKQEYPVLYEDSERELLLLSLKPQTGHTNH